MLKAGFLRVLVRSCGLLELVGLNVFARPLLAVDVPHPSLGHFMLGEVVLAVPELVIDIARQVLGVFEVGDEHHRVDISLSLDELTDCAVVHPPLRTQHLVLLGLRTDVDTDNPSTLRHTQRRRGENRPLLEVLECLEILADSHHLLAPMVVQWIPSLLVSQVLTVPHDENRLHPHISFFGL